MAALSSKQRAAYQLLKLAGYSRIEVYKATKKDRRKCLGVYRTGSVAKLDTTDATLKALLRLELFVITKRLDDDAGIIYRLKKKGDRFAQVARTG